MSQAEDLLNNLVEDEVSVCSVDTTSEPHIIVNPDRTVTVPEDLKHIAVQGDHNIETVTFDCPRYWDGHDLSDMNLRIVYQRPDGHREPYPVDNLRVDETNNRMIHFDWTISGNVTQVRGNISFTVCGKLSDSEGVVKREWHTRLNQDLIVDEGMDCAGDEIVEQNPDIIESILVRLDTAEQGGASDEKIAAAVEAYMAKTQMGGLSTTASALLLAILKDCYTASDQDANILALENELLNSSSGSGGDGSVTPETPILTGISAVLNQDNATIGTAASDLDITVTAHYSDGSTDEVSDYSISGTVASGENIFTIVYGGKTTTVEVTGTALVYSLYNQDMSGGDIDFGIELKEFKSFTVKLDITIDTSRKDTPIFIWSMPSYDAAMYWFQILERNTGSCATIMMRASSDYSVITGNNGYPSNPGDRLQFVATYNAADESCAIYFAETPSGGTMVQKNVVGTVDRTKFDGVLNAGTNGNAHKLYQGTYTVNACEISFEHTSAEDATAWIEREV